MLGEVDVAGRYEAYSILRKSRFVDLDRSLGINCQAFPWKDRGDGRAMGTGGPWGRSSYGRRNWGPG